MIDSLAGKLAEELRTNGLCVDLEPGQIVRDLKLAIAGGNIDGYALARALDDLGWRNMGAAQVEQLDAAGYWADSIVSIAVQEWASGRADELQIPNGSRVKTPWGPGVVLSRDTTMLTYAVRRDGQRDNSWTVVPAEMCTLSEPTVETANG